MALSFLNHGITDADRKALKSTTNDETWEGLREYFQKKLKENTNKLIRETVYAKRQHREFPMEARIMFANSCVPFGEVEREVNGVTKTFYVKSVPCKDKEQGKKQLEEFIENFDKDADVTKTLVKWFNENQKLKFDRSTLPEVS